MIWPATLSSASLLCKSKHPAQGFSKLTGNKYHAFIRDDGQHVLLVYEHTLSICVIAEGAKAVATCTAGRRSLLEGERPPPSTRLREQVLSLAVALAVRGALLPHSDSDSHSYYISYDDDDDDTTLARLAILLPSPSLTLAADG